MGGPLRWQVGKIGTLYCVGAQRQIQELTSFYQPQRENWQSLLFSPKKLALQFMAWVVPSWSAETGTISKTIS